MARPKSETSVKSIVDNLEVGESHDFINKGYISISSMISQLKKASPTAKVKRFKVSSVQIEAQGLKSSLYNTTVTRIK
jgi:hypothetical protein